MFLKDNTNFLNPLRIIFFVIILLITSSLFGLVISSIYGEFSLILLKIVLVNTFFISSGIILNSLVAKYLVDKIKNILIITLSFLLILGFSLIGFFFLLYLEPFFFIYGNNIVLPYLCINLFFVIALSIITTGAVIFHESLFIKEKKLNEEITLRKQIEQKLFASKINPHFLFNSLNLIISLLKNPVKAEKVLLNLSELLRYNIMASDKNEISIIEEIQNVEKYLFIQKERFEERLDYEIKCETQGLIPPLILQPLVENSIKHNLDNIDYLKIEINIFKDKENIVIYIIDSCRKINMEMLDKGIGLTNTKKRIENYGGNFLIKDGGIEIKIKLHENKVLKPLLSKN
jgi:sensor histidine kinase YesM